MRSSRLTPVLSALLALAFVAVGLPGLPGLGAAPAVAAEKNDFNPGQIISDTVFYNPASMSTAEIRTFIANKGASCVAGEAKCLKDYTEDTGNWSAEPGLCTGYAGAKNETAATIIAKVSKSCGISPQVLLVLLDKEQSLVTGTRPTLRRYTAATGFGCPDTAPCDPTYAGFATQVYGAARQFKRYADTPTRWNYQAGRTNTILWHPNASCGTSQVYIENQATAALYIYTPYRPNAAAMNNLYGTGDSCSSYGNRNFWRLFTDWFGRPDVGGFLVRTAANPNVYLINGTTKALIKDQATLTAFAPLGAVGIVPDSFLTSKTTVADARRIVRDTTTGDLYLLDSGTRYRFSSCSTVAAWGGGSCASYTDMSSSQVARFAAGAEVTRLVSTTSGKLFYLDSGKKREAFDSAAVTKAGISERQVRLAESSLSGLSVGAPLLRSGGVMKVRGTREYWLVQGVNRIQVPTSIYEGTTMRNLTTREMDAASVGTVPKAAAINGLFAGPGGTTYVLTMTGLVPVTDSTVFQGNRATVSSGVLDRLTTGAAYDGAVLFAKAPGLPTVSVVTGNRSRSVATWDDLVRISGTSSPRILEMPTITLGTAKNQGQALRPGTLVKSSASPDIFLVDGITNKVRIESFSDSDELGITGYTTVAASVLGSYATTSAPLSPVVLCGTASFAGVGGRAQARRPAVKDPKTLAVTPLSAMTCVPLRNAGGTATGKVYVKGTGQDSVFLLTDTQRRPFSSWAALVKDNGNASPLVVTVNPAALARIPQGSPVS